ncbi:hypothetical protein BC941DRAFT_518804 [Chlamydoabsidia padenii]|nr:hypothetical protein BC941DRAFT_518804 [Chlamydoabsidia padenii]
MGNSASTEQTTTTTTTTAAAATATTTTGHQRRYSNSDQQEQEQKQQTTPQTHTSFQLSVSEPTNTNMTQPNESSNSGWTSSVSPSTAPIDTTSSPKPVPGRSGWVSSTGASSPWYGGGSLSSSASSTHQPHTLSQPPQQRSHRQSISGPYYRARGMSVNQQQEPTEEYESPSTAAAASSPSYQQPSPSVSTSRQPPRLQLQQLQLNVTSPVSPVSNNPAKPDPLLKDKQTSTELGVPTIITWTQGGNNVYVTGTFNGWKHKIKLVKSTHDFNTVVDLPLGTHRLKFIVDDEWKCSNDMETATDPDGNLVNYLQVMDEEDDLGQDALFNTTLNHDGRTTPTEDYTTTIPQELLTLSEAMQQPTETKKDGMDPQQKKTILEWERKQPQPPSLPPHLEKILLNSQAVSDEDNSVLPVPNHVTLNHLYACSIKDHVMALSTTTRYRKKYVTTMYYRPVQ